MPKSFKENFIEEVIKIVDRWSFDRCAFCEEGIMVSIVDMLDFKCNKCGKAMSPTIYLGEIAKAVYDFRELFEQELS